MYRVKNKTKNKAETATADKKKAQKSMTFDIYEPKEGDLCVLFYRKVKILQDYNQLTNIKVIHMANESLSGRAYTIKLLRMGLLPGLADYHVWYGGGRSCYIEFKRSQKCKQTPSQIKFEAEARKFGFDYHLMWDVEDAINLLLKLNAI